jgi:hypothetical protein
MILKLDVITKAVEETRIFSIANWILTPNIIVGLVNPTKSGSEFMFDIFDTY